jgi:hypothetical protein
MPLPNLRAIPGSTTGLIFTGFMVGAAVIAALLLRRFLGTGDAMYGFAGLLALTLAFDLTVNQLAARGRMEPLISNWRYGGFLVGACLLVILLALTG